MGLRMFRSFPDHYPNLFHRPLYFALSTLKLQYCPIDHQASSSKCLLMQLHFQNHHSYSLITIQSCFLKLLMNDHYYPNCDLYFYCSRHSFSLDYLLLPLLSIQLILLRIHQERSLLHHMLEYPFIPYLFFCNIFILDCNIRLDLSLKFQAVFIPFANS